MPIDAYHAYLKGCNVEQAFLNQIADNAERCKYDTRPVPVYLTLPRIREWATDLGLPFSERYIQLFQEEALVQVMHHGSGGPAPTLRSVTAGVKRSFEPKDIQ
jgi:hypothetical protein